MKRIFVYGTLKTGGYNNYLLKKSTLCKKTYLKGFELYCYGPSICPIPFAVKKANKRIIGEIWEVSEDLFVGLDTLEKNHNYVSEYLTDINCYIWYKKNTNTEHSGYIGECYNEGEKY